MQRNRSSEINAKSEAVLYSMVVRPESGFLWQSTKYVVLEQEIHSTERMRKAQASLLDAQGTSQSIRLQLTESRSLALRRVVPTTTRTQSEQPKANRQCAD